MGRVKDVLGYRDLYSVEPHLTAAEVAHRMAELHVGAILVIDSDKTRREEAHRVKRILLSVRLPLLGVIVNRTGWKIPR